MMISHLSHDIDLDSVILQSAWANKEMPGDPNPNPKVGRGFRRADSATGTS